MSHLLTKRNRVSVLNHICKQVAGSSVENENLAAVKLYRAGQAVSNFKPSRNWMFSEIIAVSIVYAIPKM